MKKIIVTGATSMIGSAIIRAALTRPIETIYAVVRPQSRRLHQLPTDERIKVIECAVEDIQRLPDLIPDACDTFYHIAWGLTGSARNQNILAQTANIDYTILAVQAAKKLGCQRFIGAGSQAEYGYPVSLPMAPASPANPVQAYGIAKYAAGKLASQEASRLEMDFFWVRIFSVYGPFDKPTTMIASTIQRMKAGEATAFTKGEQIWDYLYEDDAARAFILIGEKSVGNRIYCLGSGQGRPLRDYITTMKDVINPALSVSFGSIPYPKNGPLSICADISSLTQDTGWKPTVSFREGILRML